MPRKQSWWLLPYIFFKFKPQKISGCTLKITLQCADCRLKGRKIHRKELTNIGIFLVTNGKDLTVQKCASTRAQQVNEMEEENDDLYFVQRQLNLGYFEKVTKAFYLQASNREKMISKISRR